jgi:hypothetical protein
MTILLIVEKNGNIKETKVKSLQVSELYKKAGFKSEEGFLEPVVSWPRPGIDPFTLDYQIQVFGKTKGRAGQENKYDFPPPIDTTLFFGNVAMIAVRPDGVVVDLTMSAWEMVYEQLFGGFEDLVDSHGRPLDDSEEESEDLEVEGYEYTKEGYVKDDFIVDDDDEDELEENPVFRKLLDSEEEDSEFEPPSKKSTKSVKKSDKKVDAKPDKKPVTKKSSKSVVKKGAVEVVEVVAPVVAPEVVVDNFVKVEKKAKKSKKAKSEPIVLEISEPVAPEPPTPEPTSEEEEPETKSKKPRKARAVKEPKEAKVKKVKELKESKEKSEPKKKTKRSGKKILDDIDSETVYVPMDTTELEEEKYV